MFSLYIISYSVTIVTLSFIPAAVNASSILVLVAPEQPTILIVLNEVQPLKIFLISVTLLVFHLLKSKDVRLLQLENILLILVTLLVSNLLKSKVVRLLQLRNI